MKTLTASVIVQTLMTTAAPAHTMNPLPPTHQPTTAAPNGVEGKTVPGRPDGEGPVVSSAEQMDEVTGGFKPVIVAGASRLIMWGIDKLRGRDGLAHAPTRN